MRSETRVYCIPMTTPSIRRPQQQGVVMGLKRRLLRLESLEPRQLLAGVHGALELQADEMLGPSGVTESFAEKFPTVERLANRSTPYLAEPESLDTTHMLRVAYVIPSNRSPQTSGVVNLQDFLPRMREWFREQMDRNGFGSKTLRYETEADGVTPRIHVVNVDVTDEFLREDVWQNTIDAATEAGVSVWSSGEVWLLIPECHRQSSDGSIDGGVALGAGFGSGSSAGVAMIGSDSLFRLSDTALRDDQLYDGVVVPDIGPFPLVQDVSFPWFEGNTISSIGSSIQGAMIHELGHAFGLAHDFRNDGNFHGNLMGNGFRGLRGALYPELYPDDDARLAYGAALALNVSRYFNSDTPYDDSTAPTLDIGPSVAVDSSDHLLKIEFSAEDEDALAVALLRRDGETINELVLSGNEFDGQFTTPFYETSVGHELEVSVYDEQGNRTSRDVSINVAPGSINRAPQPSIKVDHSIIRIGETITLDASRSVDADHSIDSLIIEWDTDGDGDFDTTTDANETLQITPSRAGAFFVTALVIDPAGAQAVSAPIAIRVRDDNQQMVTIDSTQVVHAEGDSGMTNFEFTVTRSDTSASPGEVRFAVTGSGTDPADAEDFVGNEFPTGSVTFAGNAATTAISIAVAGDKTEEGNEDFTVAITGTHVVTDQSTSTGRIEKDDNSTDNANTLDVTGSGNPSAFQDGILIVRHMLGQPDSNLESPALIPDEATRRTGAAIRAHLEAAGNVLDANGDGNLSPFQDGILIVRYLLGQPAANLEDPDADPGRFDPRDGCSYSRLLRHVDAG